MEPGKPTIVYMKLRKKVVLPRGESIKLGQVALMMTEPELESKLRDLVLASPAEEDGNLILLDMITIMQKMKAAHLHVTIENLGEPHVLVEMSKPQGKPNILLIAFIWLLLFFGSGLAIMNFHADVSMKEVHQKIYQLITGDFQENPFFLQVPYSFGLGAGMILFFNRIFKRKFNEEPNPLEVEMFMYEESVRQYVVQDEYKKMTDSHRHHEG
ncbi:stage V sporulation protein AA [Marinicrinis lubricantis]|uniref:Stage V sporulation protein AA n=1 Tax=Marinicrinis lubricantis TaxID=2086470 RepID=A0ABW1ISN5_9BACL